MGWTEDHQRSICQYNNNNKEEIKLLFKELPSIYIFSEKKKLEKTDVFALYMLYV